MCFSLYYVFFNMCGVRVTGMSVASFEMLVGLRCEMCRYSSDVVECSRSNDCRIDAA